MSAGHPEIEHNTFALEASRSCPDGERSRERNAAANDHLKQMKRPAA
jgi:hypothetical protein